MSQLTEPEEGLCIIHFLCNHLCHHISSMHINGADGHDPLSVCLREVTQQQVDECVELLDLLLVVVLQSVLITLLHTSKGYVHICGPPDLSASQSHLVEQEGRLSYYILAFLYCHSGSSWLSPSESCCSWSLLVLCYIAMM